MTVRQKFLFLLLSSTLAIGLGACANVPSDPEQRKEFDTTNDPFEPLNRDIFDVNTFFDHNLWGPLSDVYTAVLPEFLRNRVHDVLSNMGEPVNFMNNSLQGQAHRSATTFARFVVNTTLGVAGTFDVATDWGLPEQHGDFGQTLWSWGIEDNGPYLVLPLFGPSNPRDTIGLVVDAIADPWGYLVPHNDSQQTIFDVSRFVVSGIDKRAEVGDALDSLEKSSVDFYAQLRSVSRQYRIKELHGEASSPEEEYKSVPADLYSGSDNVEAIYGDTGAQQNGVPVPTVGTKHAKKALVKGTTAFAPDDQSSLNAHRAKAATDGTQP